jgi:hypothetical protein
MSMYKHVGAGGAAEIVMMTKEAQECGVGEGRDERADIKSEIISVPTQFLKTSS